jgi:hypothetical protein
VNTKSGVPTRLPQPPNGLAFRCRARCTESRQKANDLARSGQLQCRVGRSRSLALQDAMK